MRRDAYFNMDGVYFYRQCHCFSWLHCGFWFDVR